MARKQFLTDMEAEQLLGKTGKTKEELEQALTFEDLQLVGMNELTTLFVLRYHYNLEIK